MSCTIVKGFNMISENDFKLKIRSEDKLILNTLRNSINPKNKSHIYSLLQKDIDWYYIIQNAYDHGLLALFHDQIISTYPQLIPEDVINILNDFFNENKNKNLILKNELLEIIKILKSNGIEAIPNNNLILAINAYPTQSLRQFANINIFVNKLDVPKIKEILTSRSYRQLFEDIDEDFYIKTENEYICIMKIKMLQLIFIGTLMELFSPFQIITITYLKKIN